MDLEGDRGRTLMALVTARAWKDADYRKRLIEDPRTVLKGEGIDVPAGLNIKILEDTDKIKYIAITRDFRAQPQHGERLAALIDKLTPIAEGNEVRLVQSSEKTRYIVIQHPPSGVQPGALSESELMKISAGGVEATSTDTTQTTVAETTEATVTETSEAQDAETTTTVAAEAELVAT